MSEPRFLTPDEILQADDRPVATINVPEWGGTIRVRALSLDDYLSLKEQHMRDGQEDERGLTTAMLQAGIVDQDGEACFTLEQARSLLNKSAVPLGRVMKAIGQVTGSDGAKASEAAATFRPSAER